MPVVSMGKLEYPYEHDSTDPKGKTNMPTIKTMEFVRDQFAWNGDRMTLDFPAKVDGKRIVCRVSREALDDHFEAKASGYEAAFLNNWARIKDVAQRKINRDDYSDDGSILVSTFDF